MTSEQMDIDVISSNLLQAKCNMFWIIPREILPMIEC